MRNNLDLQSLRTLVRKNGRAIIKNIVDNHINRNHVAKNKLKICMFCSSMSDITREHVLPRWVFKKDTKRFFITDVNGQRQTYNTTTIAACSNCNTNILNSLEKYIKNLFNGRDLNKISFSNEEIQNIIRWLEIIDYKFHVLDVVRTFKSSSHAGYVPYLADFPISVLREKVNFSPTKVIAELRRSQIRIGVKRKDNHVNSLVTFKTSNKGFYFFHHLNEFIFIELPRQQIAILYFYSQIFNDELTARDASLETLKKFYN